MITIRILLSPGRRGRVVDASGRSVPQPLPAPVIGSAEPLRIILLDPATLDPADPYGFDTGAPLRLTISGDWDPATIPVYATNDIVRTSAGIYDLADPSGTRTAEALALLGVLAERLCAWELTAYGGNPATEADWAHPLSVVQFDAPLRQRADSLGGDPAEAPAVDLRGPAGQDGAAATVAVGETTTLPAGSAATVENVGTLTAAVFNFGIPGSSGVSSINGYAAAGSTVGALVLPNLRAVKHPDGDFGQVVSGTINYAAATTGFVRVNSFSFPTASDSQNPAAGFLAVLVLDCSSRNASTTFQIAGTTGNDSHSVPAGKVAVATVVGLEHRAGFASDLILTASYYEV